MRRHVRRVHSYATGRTRTPSGAVIPSTFVNGNAAVDALAGRRITTPGIVFTRGIDHHLPYPYPDVRSHRVVFSKCEKRFVFYCMQPHRFPCATEVFLDSHPSEPRLLHWWGTRAPCAALYLHERLEGYKRRWGIEYDNVVLISDDAWREALACCVPAAPDGRPREAGECVISVPSGC